ncbi:MULTISPECIES: ABC transporter ATP-binding protein [Falsihalocynthiibacter]|uniref:ABC transporter ATP-binding protein n=1 Tax=Falsihalocynthiibacter TaxID=2854182 RepID=UPI00300301CB
MVLRKLLPFAYPFRYPLILVALLMLLESVATLIIPWLVGQLAGGILADETISIGLIVILLIALLGLLGLLRFTTQIFSGRTAERFLAEIRVSVFGHLQKLPLAFHQKGRQGDVLALMTNELPQLSSFITGTLVSIPPLLLTTLGAIVLMFRIDPILALLVPAIVPAFYIILKVIGRRLRGLARMAQHAEAMAVGLAEEGLEMLPAVKAFTRENAELNRYKAQIDQVLTINLQENRINAALGPIVQFVAGTAAVLLLLFAGLSLQTGSMTTPEMFSFLLYAAILTRPVGTLANVYGQTQTARGTLERLLTVLNEKPEAGYAEPREIEQTQGDIEFRGVSFAYPDRPAILKDVSLHIESGETIALAGENGAGKSTLISLLVRLFDPDTGTVLLDGCDISSLNLLSLRQKIGLVPQRASLFNGSIRDNIAYGLEGATDADINKAARLAQAYDFITKLPDGFGTEIGDHGVRLSGGQRQRIALARAFLKDPQILILDEATSMYDIEGEQAFIETCGDALKDRTVILITHRTASLTLADRVLCLVDGRIVEENGKLT